MSGLYVLHRSKARYLSCDFLASFPGSEVITVVLDKGSILGPTTIDMPNKDDLLLHPSRVHRDMVPSCFFFFPERVKCDDVEIRDKGFADRIRMLHQDCEDKSLPPVCLTNPISFDSLRALDIIVANVQMISSPQEKPYLSL